MKKFLAAAGLLAVLWTGGTVQAQEGGAPAVEFDWQRGPSVLGISTR